MPQLLIELFSEEIPARMQLQAAKDFERLMGGKLTASGLTFDSIRGYVGPRRLALVVDGLPAETQAVSEEVKGPREGAPPQALEGFLRKVGLTQEQLIVENGVYLARIEKPGVKTADVLGAMLKDVILGFPWPKSMRSGTSSFRWVRPLKRILFVFDGAVIPFELEGIVASNLTEGHRFLGSGQPLQAIDFSSYQRVLAKNSVILDHLDRQTLILEQAKAVCAAAGCELIEDAGLLEEVAGLNEFPVPLLGDMDPRFLTLPPEVIKTSMRTHQKYFAVRGKDGKMAAHFVITANMKAIDGGAEIKRGNAKVLSARLSDGVFFWDEDNRAGNFDGWLKKLEGVTFHARLGTMAQRVDRITALAGFVAGQIGADVEKTKAAARLAKADLASHMVMEFPELQGVMGGYYADAAGMDADVANAVREHYKPQGPGDSLPTAKVSAAVALADKIDTLVAFFAIDEKPTGSKDPYALRRSALGILRILRDQGARLPLGGLVEAWYAHLAGTAPSHFRAYEIVRSEILDFFTDRLKVQLREDGRPLDVIEAVLAQKDDDVVRVIRRIDAVQAARSDDLVAAYKRPANILAAAKWDRPAGDLSVPKDAPDVEGALIAQLTQAKSQVAADLRIENFQGALLTVAAMRQNIDAFLDGVLVNESDEAVRARRLNLLANVCSLPEGIADLSKLA